MTISVPDLLLAFLAAAVALAGFSGIVALIDRGAAQVSLELASFRLRFLILTALSTIVLSVTPLLAIALLGESQTLWRVACGLQAIWGVSYMVRTMMLRRTFRGEAARGIRVGQFYAMTAVGALAQAILLAGVFAYLPAPASYAAGVFWFLLMVAVFFMRLVFMLDESLRNAERRP
ncbi:MAG TPA: hypothetical protein VKT24_01970 [Rhizomicrobium sp.]|nr:hypothetical protein [Rhizomicrobium sp.]